MALNGCEGRSRFVLFGATFSANRRLSAEKLLDADVRHDCGGRTLPCGWFVEGAVGVGQGGRELAEGQNAGADLFVEMGDASQRARGTLLRIEHTDDFLESLTHRSNRCNQVGVIGHEHGAIELVVEGIDEQLSGEVDVGAFFVGSPNPSRGGTARAGVDQLHRDFVGFEITKLDREFGQGPQRSKIHLLAYRLIERTEPR